MALIGSPHLDFYFASSTRASRFFFFFFFSVQRSISIQAERHNSVNSILILSCLSKLIDVETGEKQGREGTLMNLIELCVYSIYPQSKHLLFDAVLFLFVTDYPSFHYPEYTELFKRGREHKQKRKKMPE